MRVLEQYPWPGNVRELKNSVEAMIVVAQSQVLDIPDMPEWLTGSAWPSVAVPSPGPPESVDAPGVGQSGPLGDTGAAIPVHAGMTWDEIERAAIRSTLDMTGGNKAEAARVLAIGRRTLFRKLKEYGL